MASLLVTAAFALANIPGNPAVGPDVLGDGKYGPHFECGWQHVVHGWPLAYLIHEGRYSRAGDGPSAWHVGRVSQFRPVFLAVNAALFLLGTFATGWLAQRHIEKHQWRFTTIHLLAAVLCVALVAAFVTHRIQVHRAQVAHVQRAGDQSVDYAEWQPFGPYWLRTLTGRQYWEWGDLLAAAEVEHSDENARLPGKNAIKVLRISTLRCDAMPSLNEYDHLIAIDMSQVNYDYSNFEGDGDPEFWPCLRVIAQCRSLQGLNLYDAGVTDRGLQELARMPNLKHLELSANPEITDDGLVYLGSLRSLQKLGLWGTGVTKNGVEDLQTALPECKIGWNGMSR